jgi:hypothetical protein
VRKLKQFLAEAEVRKPQRGTLGVESDWMVLSGFTLKGTRFLICDFQFIPSEKDGLIVKAASGKYSVAAKVMDFDGDCRISRMRIFQRHTKPVLGVKIGETWVDTGYSAVCDFDSFSKEWDSVGEDAAGDKLQEAYGVEIAGCFRWIRKAQKRLM